MMLHQPKQPLKKLKKFDAQNNWRLYAESEEHLYAGDFYPSVTTILSLLVSDKDKNYLLYATKDSYDSTMDKAAAFGTLLHDFIESDLSSREFIPNEALLEELNLTRDDFLSVISDAFKNWVHLKKKESLSGVVSEIGVYSDLYGYAGTLDHILRENDFPCVGELKTGQYKIHAGWQACAYYFAYHELYDVQEEMGVRGIHVHRNGKEKAYFRYKQLLSCFRAFLGAHECWRMIYYNELAKMQWRFVNTSAIEVYVKNYSNYQQWRQVA